MRIYRGRVTDVSDTKNQGRIKVELQGFCSPGLGVDPDYPKANTTAWCHVLTPFAGSGYGFYFLPQLGDTVVATSLENGEFLILGYHWTGAQGKPSEGNSSTRVIKTPSGHRLQFVEGGDVIVRNQSGAEVKLKANGDVELNGTSGGGVITKKCICAFTGSEHPQESTSVKAKGAI